MRYRSWGGMGGINQTAIPLFWTQDPFPDVGKRSALPFGNGRSYGDSCLNEGGVLLDTRGLSRFLSFDPSSGILALESGVLLSEVLSLSVPSGWFLPVTPGTRFVTVGGAIANDVHGKNHHRDGTFGCHVRKLCLLRSDGSKLICSQNENQDIFSATIGGLGLTGVILWAEIALKRIKNPLIRSETIRFDNLTEFFRLSDESDLDYEYTVSWIDCLGRGKNLGRGLFMRGNHATVFEPSCSSTTAQKNTAIPFTPPFSLVNTLTLRGFNTLYYWKNRKRHMTNIGHYEPFFYPLDGVLHWNRLYGRKGFFQYQCVVPKNEREGAVREILQQISQSGEGSFLAVLKAFGDLPSPGLLSFPRPGVTLALDFPNREKKTLELLDCLDGIVAEAGGAVYPAKDARMTGERFRQFFPRWNEFLRYKDPAFSSEFWRRVMKGIE